MNLKNQSVAADSNEQSVAADVAVVSGAAANSLTVSSLIERYMAACAERDPTRSQRLIWSQGQVQAREAQGQTSQVTTRCRRLAGPHRP